MLVVEDREGKSVRAVCDHESAIATRGRETPVMETSAGHVPTSVSPTGAADPRLVATPTAQMVLIHLSRAVAVRACPYTKRLLDLVVAFVALVVLSPLLLGIALAVALSSPGPVVFSHRRVGRQETPFSCLKFRTMLDGAERMLDELLEDDPQLAEEFSQDFKLRSDPRVTNLGKWLRRTSLDELPQFWNVLRGDMSLVGPRPVVTEELERYGEARSIVLTARPGITGAWQVSGRNDVDYAERVALDVAYVAQRTFLGDVLIIVRTLMQMLATRRNGAY
jgi:lipopolysaccharide/colanic/teichoic acid biosynthesis glycosyltransferase